MLRNLRSRRRPRYGPQLCAVISALLLLLSVSLLYTRLSSTSLQHHHSHSRNDAVSTSLISDSDDTSAGFDDKIDEHDDTPERNDNDEEEQENDQQQQAQVRNRVSSSGYYVDHVTGSIRRALNKRSIEEWDSDDGGFMVGMGVEGRSSEVFGSDDVAIDEEVRRKVSEVDGVEHLLLLKVGKKVSPLREGWGDWFDKKGDFLRRDRMFKSNLEALNPLNNALLQDPDGVGVTGLTRVDKAVQKLLLSEFKRTPFLVKKTLSVSDGDRGEGGVKKTGLGSRSEVKAVERRTLDDNARNGTNVRDTVGGNGLKMVGENGLIQVNRSSNGSYTERVVLDSNGNSSSTSGDENRSYGEQGQVRGTEKRKSEELSHLYADGKRWGYFPGLHPHLSFSDFIEAFFWKGKCDMRVFMIWNSPPWMYGVRHQRGLESLLSYHKNACVVMFSETIELDFFRETFVKDGYKVAVAMPNLDELLNDTPTHIFASVWFQWRKTKFYSRHYSELVRLAALYKYGGVYLDSDVIVLNPLSSLDDTVGREDQSTESSLNGAVMAFKKHSQFLKECLEEFYVTYDDKKLRWNGADLLTRVARRFLSKENKSAKRLELQVQPSYIFFPASPKDIASFFTAPATKIEEAKQEAFLKKIARESLTFHFWNSLTYALVPEPGSLVAKLINRPCIRCTDVL